jgi:hypothetical protein
VITLYVCGRKLLHLIGDREATVNTMARPGSASEAEEIP